MIYIGLDVHRDTTTIAMVSDSGEVLRKPWRVRTSDIGAELAGIEEPCLAVVEALSMSHFVTRQLESCGVGSVTVHAATSGGYAKGMHTAKTDRLDAIALGKMMAYGMLDDAIVWEPDEKTHELRVVTRARQKLSRMNAMTRNMIRQLTARYAANCPAVDLLGQTAGEWLDAFAEELSDDVAEVLSAYRELLVFINALLERLAKTVAEATKDDETVARLRTIPGVGPTLAPVIAAEIGHVGRFDSAQELRAYSGLVPRVRQSGERTVIGRLTRRGNRHLRRALVQAAELFKQSGATKGLRLRSWYYGQLHRHGPNPARVALARKLLSIIYAMLRDGTDFDPSRFALDPAA